MANHQHKSPGAISLRRAAVACIAVGGALSGSLTYTMASSAMRPSVGAIVVAAIGAATFMKGLSNFIWAHDMLRPNPQQGRGVE